MCIASLPMYDWPAIRAETDRFWDRLYACLDAVGIAAPRRLSRADDHESMWLSPALLLSQSCGYPFSTVLKDRVTLIGTPAYAIDAPAGGYFSVVVARAGEESTEAHGLAGRRFAFNASNSQSGFRAPLRWLAAQGAPPPASSIETGSHRGSIRAVAEDRADFAAIDAVSWQLALRHEPAAGSLAVVTRTPVTPGLPFITALTHASTRRRLAAAVDAAIASIEDDVRDALLLRGFVRSEPADYAQLADDVMPAAAK